MGRKLSNTFKTASLALAAGLALTGVSQAKESADVIYDTENYLPVRSGGHRFTSDPYGEVAAILIVVSQVKSQGVAQRISSRGLHIPNKTGNRTVARYDYTFPKACGGATFSYYEGNEFSALGLHHNGKVVFDTLQGGGPYSAPRLWGPYDQVINDPAPMRVVYSQGGKSGFGLVSASFMAGEVADLPASKRDDYGRAYSARVVSAGSCDLPASQPGTLVRK